MATASYLVVVHVASFTGYFNESTSNAHFLLTPVVFVLSVFAAGSSEPRLHGTTALQHVYASIRFSSILVAGLLVVLFAGRFENSSRLGMLAFAGITTAAYLFNRLCLTWYYLRGRIEHESNFLQVLLIGSGPRAVSLARKYQENSDWGVEIIGSVDPDPSKLPDEVPPDIPMLGAIQNIDEILSTKVVDEVIICTPRSFASLKSAQALWVLPSPFLTAPR